MVSRAVILLAAVAALALIFLLPRVFEEADSGAAVPPVQLRPAPATTPDRDRAAERRRAERRRAERRRVAERRRRAC